MNTLYVLFDHSCGLCTAAARWLREQPAFIRIITMPATSDRAAAKFPDLDLPRSAPGATAAGAAPEQVIVVTDEGQVYRGPAAWIMCLWALKRYRAWSLMLAQPHWRPRVARIIDGLGRRRLMLSRLLMLEAEADAVARGDPDSVVCPGGTCRPAEQPRHCRSWNSAAVGAVQSGMRGTHCSWALVLAMVAAVLSVPRAAQADGKMFSTAIADVSGAQMPDQAALIVYDAATKKQTLAIETRFVGTGTDFGWIVPLPSRPVVTPGTTGMFPCLRGMFAPIVKRSTDEGLSFALAMLLLAALCAVYLPKYWRTVCATLLVVLFLAAVMLPTLGTARGGAGAPIAEPEFIERRIVGDFEVTTLESPRGEAVVQWLRDHGFHVPAAAESAVHQHAREGWSFVATRLTREASTSEPTTAHPLVFTFTTDAPIYPMRLTGAGAERDLAVELFVFGASRAKAAGFAAAAGAPVMVHDEPHGRVWHHASRISVLHSTLGPLVQGAAYGTRLTATLKPADMQRDIAISWTGSAAPTGRTAHSENSRAGLAVNIGLVCAFCAAAFIGLFERTRGLRRGTAMVAALVIGPLSGIVTVGAVSAVPSIRPRDMWRSSNEVLGEFYKRAEGGERAGDLAHVRARLDEFLAGYNAANETKVLRGDGPGQVELRERDGMIWIVTVDAGGAEYWNDLWEAAAEPPAE